MSVAAYSSRRLLSSKRGLHPTVPRLSSDPRLASSASSFITTPGSRSNQYISNRQQHLLFSTSGRLGSKYSDLAKRRQLLKKVEEYRDKQRSDDSSNQSLTDQLKQFYEAAENPQNGTNTATPVHSSLDLSKTLSHYLESAKTAARAELLKMSISKPSVRDVLKGKYPAKIHAKKVKEYILSNLQSADEGVADGVIYLESQRTRMNEDNDQEAPFRQRRYFFYLTGCDLPDSSVVYDLKSEKTTLFIPPVDPEEVIWSGLPMSREEAMQK